MKYLLDTCTLIWLCTAPERISSTAKTVIDNQQHDLLVSYVSLWEMSLKSFAGKLRFPKPFRRWIAEQENIWNFMWLEIEMEHLLLTGELPEHHKDPFDRLLVAQAKRENLPVVTPDQYIHRYSVECLW